MREVMLKAQALAEAIVESETYKTMHDLEEQVTKDEKATALIAAYMEKFGLSEEEAKALYEIYG